MNKTDSNSAIFADLVLKTDHAELNSVLLNLIQSFIHEFREPDQQARIKEILELIRHDK